MLPNPPVHAAGQAASAGRLVAWLVAAMLTSACTKDQPAPKATATVTLPSDSVPSADSVVTAVVSRWDAADGPAIYLPSEGGLAQVVLPPVHDDSVPRPDSAALPAGAAPATVDLFSPAGKVGTVTLGAYAPSGQPAVGAGCDAWAVVPVRDAAGVTPPGWRLALLSGVAEPLRTDSLGSLSRADSAALVIAINKAAALLPLDSAGLLRRVPFGVTKAYRVKLFDETEVVVAIVERRLNLEAAPRVERTTLVLERSAATSPMSAVWRETQYATEDDLIAVDLLAVVHLHGVKRPTVFLGLDFGDGSRVQMLQRTAKEAWSLRWSSAYTGC
ncbi:MAG: hypothetical protein V4813_13680 [Gemmatimonadota bacterium]